MAKDLKLDLKKKEHPEVIYTWLYKQSNNLKRNLTITYNSLYLTMIYKVTYNQEEIPMDKILFWKMIKL